MVPEGVDATNIYLKEVTQEQFDILWYRNKCTAIVGEHPYLHVCGAEKDTWHHDIPDNCCADKVIEREAFGAYISPQWCPNHHKYEGA